MGTVNVAHRDHLDTGHRSGGVDEVAAPGAEADAAYADGFVRGLRRQESRRKGRGGGQRRSGLAGVVEELPAGKSRLGAHSVPGFVSDRSKHAPSFVLRTYRRPWLRLGLFQHFPGSALNLANSL